MHQLGYLHLDLKPENILITTSNMTRLESSALVLIDYGVSQRYLDHKGHHVKETEYMPFVGNVLFASKNAFMNIQQTRRDDLISLCYLLAFFFQGEISWWPKNLKFNDPEFFKKVKKIKSAMTPTSLCSGMAKGLLPFVAEVFSYSFE